MLKKLFLNLLVFTLAAGARSSVEESLFSAKPLIESAFVSAGELADREVDCQEGSDSENLSDDRILPVGETLDPVVFRVSDQVPSVLLNGSKGIELFFQTLVVSPRAPPV